MNSSTYWEVWSTYSSSYRYGTYLTLAEAMQAGEKITNNPAIRNPWWILELPFGQNTNDGKVVYRSNQTPTNP